MFLNSIGQLVTSVLCMCNAFRIKMHWEDGYMWQGVDYEFEKFCMMHSYRGFPGYGKCFYGTQTGMCEDDAVYVVPCNADLRQKWTFVPSGNGEFQIKALSAGTCLERLDSRRVRLRDCDDSIARQRWYTPGTDFFSTKFAISQSTADGCLGQLHHPKSGEVIELRNCRQSERTQTLYWEKE